MLIEYNESYILAHILAIRKTSQSKFLRKSLFHLLFMLKQTNFFCLYCDYQYSNTQQECVALRQCLYLYTLTSDGGKNNMFHIKPNLSNEQEVTLFFIVVIWLLYIVKLCNLLSLYLIILSDYNKHYL